MEKGNKGEWSEAYAFVKLLGEGKVYVADKELNKIDEKSYSILKIYKENIKKYYEIDSDRQVINVADINGNILSQIDSSRFIEIAEESLEDIKKSKGSSFEVPILKQFLNDIGIDKFKSSSKKKEDIKMEVLDTDLGKSETFTFSIKSHVGSKPSLLNASLKTNFTFLIKGLDEESRLYLNGLKKDNGNPDLKKRFGEVFKGYEKGRYLIDFVDEKDNIFYQNLRLIDDGLPNILAYLLFYFYSHERNNDLGSLINKLIEFNPLNFDNPNIYKEIIYKFIEAAAFGMRPGEEWDKNNEVTGGLLSVKKEGDILCHPKFYDEIYLSDYLFNKVKFDTPSTTRYDFGELKRLNVLPFKNFILDSKYEDKQIEEDIIFFKLNLLLKFK